MSSGVESPLRTGFDSREAAASIGTDRGITAFLRYSLLKRRGKSYLALPAGRFPVREQADTDLIRELDRILDTVDRFARAFPASSPARFVSLRRQIDSAIYDFVLRGSAVRLQRTLAAIGRLERFFAQRSLALEPKLRAPLQGLSSRWLLAANDGAVNYRIAVAIASIRAEGEVGPIRANLAPVDPGKPWMWATGRGQMAFQGGSFSERLVSVLRRRLMDAERLTCELLPFGSFIAIAPEDAAAFALGKDIDEPLIEDLVFGLTLVNWRDAEFNAARLELYRAWRSDRTIVPRNYALLKHLFEPHVDVRPEPSLISLLLAGRTAAACDLAQRRLRSAGCMPRTAVFRDEPDGVRLAASLLIPIHPIERLSRLVLRESKEVHRKNRKVIMFSSLTNVPRLLLEQELRPVQGERFQPTGFSDLGAAEYRLHDGRRMLLVESAQSIANHLEKTCVAESGCDVIPELSGLPYVKAKLRGATETETSSLIEAHRINSPFIISDTGFQASFVEQAAYEKGKPVDWRKAAAALFRFDPNALLHGVFMANLLMDG